MDHFDNMQPQTPPSVPKEDIPTVPADGVPYDALYELEQSTPFADTPVYEAPSAQPEYAAQEDPVPLTECASEVPPEPQQPPRYCPQAEAYVPHQEATPYRGAGKGRKESPYANSPYVMYHQQEQQEYRYQPQTQPPEKPEKPKKEKQPRKPVFRRVMAVLLTVALVAGSCLVTAFCVNSHWEVRMDETERYLMDKINGLQEQVDSMGTPAGAPAQIPTVTGDLLTPSQIYAQCVNSVVAISSTVQSSGYYGTTEGSSTGSGFILTEDGYIITNYHVVEDATAIEVTTHDGTKYPAKLVGFDSANDLAVLKVEATGLSAATLGNSSDLLIGDMVVAIGNPLGELTATQTVGYVSGINREVSTDNSIISMIQTDAAINPGNSGGPLFNARGEVIGITTAKYSGTTGSGASIEGIGFAIPIDDIKPGISDLIDYGYVTGAYLGVTVQNTDPEAAAQFGLPVGATVISVTPGYSADRAGVQANDIIIGIGDYEVSSITELTRALRNFKAGDTTTITVIRSGSRLTLEITLDEKPRENGAPQFPENDPKMPSEGDPNEWYDYFFGE